MNRHARRAAEAQTRNSFKQYDALYRRAFKKVDERDIGESWMRAAAADAGNIKGMVLHPTNEAPPPREACDVEISAAYGPQRFVAYAKSDYIATLEQSWPAFVDIIRKIGGNPLTGDMRCDARQFVFEMIVTNVPYSDATLAALTASAIVWLAATSAAGDAVGRSHKHIHYEITDTGPAAPPGSGARNFRLMLTR
jgi:hypothetical protein